MKFKILQKYDVWIIFLLTLFTFTLLKLQQFHYFIGVNAELIDWYEITLWNFLNGKFFIANHNIPLFSEHFSPIIIFLLPVYYLFQSPYCLVVIHALVCALAIIPLFHLTAHYFENRFVPIGLCLTYFFSRTVNYGLMFDFHLEVFYPFLLFCILLFYTKEKWSLFYIFVILCLMVKEDSSIPIIGLGIYLFFSSFKKQGIIVVVIGLLWLVISVELIIPLYRSVIGKVDYGFWSYWYEYGLTQKEIILNMLNPIKNATILFTDVKIKSMVNYFSVFLFLPFGSFKAFLFLVFPNWFLLFSSGNSMMYNAINYYGLLSIPFLFFSSIITLKKIISKYNSKKVLVIIVTLMIIVNAANSRYWKLFVEEPMQYSERYETVKQIIQTIPLKGSISAQGNLVGHITPREQRVFFPQNIENVEFILLDQKGNKCPLNEEDYIRQVNSLRSNPNYKVEIDSNGFLLFKNLKLFQ